MPPLPQGWQQLYDPASGRHYYLDEVLQITTWERPAPDAAPGR
jgi:hypothetical protein